MTKSATQGTGSQLLSIFGYDLTTNQTSSKQQMAYHDGNGLWGNTDADIANERPLKMSFDASDQYLLGGQSCGAFLFVSSFNIDTLKESG